MNRSKRYGVLSILAIFLLPIAFAGCILVVEEDDYDRRHHRHGVGVDWYVEFVFYKSQSISPATNELAFTFVDETNFEGVTECGDFYGTYEINERDEISVHTIESSGAACDEEGVSGVFLNELVYAEAVESSDDRLRIETRGDNYILLADEK